MKIGGISLSHPFVIAPMAGMTDSAFRRLVKRQGGCGLVVTEMVSSEGLVRGIDRTLEYTEYTDEERPVSIQIFGGDPQKMADAAQIVESLGADIVDVNMGCPVPKISKHNAGCSLMREPAHAASVVEAMTRRVRIPVTVKMRAGWNDDSINAPELAKRVEDAGAAAVAVHGRTAAQSYTGQSDWSLIDHVASSVNIPVFGSGDCVEPEQILERMRTNVSGVLVGRGVLRNPWILAQASDLCDGRPMREVTLEERGRFLLDYMDLLISEAQDTVNERWIINKMRALMSWYSKGLHNGGHLRTAINAATSINEARDIISTFFRGAMVVLALMIAGACSPSASNERVQAVYNKETGRLNQLTVDTAKDGKPDVYSYMDGRKFVRVEIDTDEDGKIDRWEYYGSGQKLEKVGMSRARNGVADAWAYQGPDGVVSKIEVSTKHDGKANRTEFYVKGELARAEEDTNADGQIDKWETYEKGALVTAAFDTTGSGQADRTIDYRSETPSNK